MKERNPYVLFFLLSLSFYSCTEPYDEKISIDPKEQLEVYKIVQSLPADEKSEVEQYMARMKEQLIESGQGIPQGMTIRQALEEQKKWHEEQAEKERKKKEAAERAAKEREYQKTAAKELQKKMSELCSVSVTKKLFQKSSYSSHFNLELTFTNKSKKDLVFVKGKLGLYDEKNTPIKSIKIPYRKTIKAGKSASSKGDFPYKESRTGDQILAKIPLKKIKVKWMPILYHFKDGSKMSVEILDDSP